jgi:RNA polymerase sigma-70 factor (ECF subfamily)
MRDNASWLDDLGSTGHRRDRAILDLRDFLLRAILVYVSRQRSDLAGLDFDELRQLAEDWAQLALLKVLEQRQGFRGDSKFTTWAYRVAINLVAGELRRKRWADVSLDALTDAGAPESRLRGDDELPGPEARVTRTAVWEAVRLAIDEDLTERQRAVITRVVLDDIAPEALAVELGTNRNNIYKILHDARRKLKRSLLDRHWSAEEMLAAFAGAGDGGSSDAEA